MWVFFAITNALAHLFYVTVTWEMFKVQYDPIAYQLSRDGFEILSFFGFLSIFFVASFYPESLLITETQLIQATNLQETFKRSKLSETELKNSNKYLSFLDTEKKLVDYIACLPEELRQELNISNLKADSV